MKTTPISDEVRQDLPEGKPARFPEELTPEEKKQFFAREGVDPLSSAFDKKTTIHAGAFGTIIEKEDIKKRYAQIMETERNGPSAAYFHIPFCETHCLYCGFYSTPYREGRSEEYTDQLINELESERATIAVRSGPVNAVYFGGGTPTSLEPRDLRRLLEATRSTLPLAEDCEVTIEGRILNFTEEKMQACLEGGANRFSLGVQTFDTEIRQRQGRSCDREEVCRTLEKLRNLGNAAVIIDLIYGLPGQTMAGWKADIDTCKKLGLDGADLYQLNVYPGGKLDRAIKKGALPPAADLSRQSELFAAGVSKMESNGMRRLSITHWAGSNRERNIYNPLMKSKADCLAFGAGAGGMLGGVLYCMERNYKAYMESRSKGKKPVVMMSEPPANIAMVQSLTSQLERGALDLEQTSQTTGLDAAALFAPLLRQWEKAGLLQLEDAQATLTLAGQFWQVNITQSLINWHKLKV